MRWDIKPMNVTNVIITPGGATAEVYNDGTALHTGLKARELAKTYGLPGFWRVKWKDTVGA